MFVHVQGIRGIDGLMLLGFTKCYR